MPIIDALDVTLDLDSYSLTLDGRRYEIGDLMFLWLDQDGNKVFYDPSEDSEADDSYLKADEFGAMTSDGIYCFSPQIVQGDDFYEVLDTM